jgi:hypothetical protein
MITAAGPRLTIPVPETSSAASGRSIRLIDVERTHIRRVLESTRWRIRGIGGAAEQLGLKPTTRCRGRRHPRHRVANTMPRNARKKEGISASRPNHRWNDWCFDDSRWCG